MAVEGSGEPNLLRHSDEGYDDDDIPLSVRLLGFSNLGTSSSSFDAGSVKKRPTKRPFTLIKKSKLKVSPDDDNEDHIPLSRPFTLIKKSKLMVSPDDDNEDHIPLSRRIKRLATSAHDKSLPNVTKFASTLEGQKKKQVEEQGQKKRDSEDSSGELEHKKKHLACVRRINGVHEKIQKKIEECVKDVVAMEAQLSLMEGLVRERELELKIEETELHQVMDNIDKDRERKEEELKALFQNNAECTKKLGFIRRNNQVHKKKLSKIEECVKDLVITVFSLMGDLFREHGLWLKEEIDKEHERKKEEFKALLPQKVSECYIELKTQEKELDAIKKLTDGQAKKLDSESKKLHKVMSTRADQHAQKKDFDLTKKQFEGQIKEPESKEKHYERRVKESKSKEKRFEGRVKKLESREKHLKAGVKEFELKEKEVESQVKEIELKKRNFESQVKELESKEKQFEGRVKELELKEEEFEGQLKEWERKKTHFESRVKELESKENQLKGRMKKFESIEEEFEDQMKELKSKEKQLEGQVKDFESKKEEFEGQEKELALKEKQFEGQGNELEDQDIKFEVQAKELNSKEKSFKELEFKEKQFELLLKELKSKEKQDEQLKELDLTEKQYEVLIKSFDEEKELDNQSSPTIDGRTFRLLPIEKTDEPESLDNEILDDLKATSDPSKVVLDIIQKPIVPHFKDGDDAVIMNSSNVFLLEQLLSISPQIKPHVRKEAMKLALDLKANMRTSIENSLEVLGFLLLLSIYGLIPFFDEEEVLKLFEFAAQHKQTVELFQTMGFADKISDFVQNLINKQQYIEAVRFICAYKLVHKNRPLDLLREYVQNAKLISDIICMNTNSLEIKHKAIDQEIAKLKNVLQCISENNLESEDLVDEIEDRLIELNMQKVA